MPPASEHPRTRLLARLQRLRRRLLLIRIGGAICAVVGAALGVGAVGVALEAGLYLAPAWRLVLVVVITAAAVAGGARALWPLRHGLGLHTLALDIERQAPELAQRLITALELGSPERRHGLYSSDLLAATVAEAAALLDGLAPSRIAPSTPLRHAALGAAAVAGVVLVVGLAGGDVALQALTRVLHPTVAYERPQRTLVHVTPGDFEVVRGDAAAMTIHLDGDIPPTVRVRRREAGAPSWSTDEVVLEAAHAGSLRYAFDDVRRRFEYRVHAGDGDAGPFTVDVIEPPRATRLRLRYGYPEHTGLAPRVEEEGGDIRALAGTRVDFEIYASKRLAAAALVVDDSLRLPAQVTDDRAQLSWRLPAVTDSLGGRHTYFVHLTDLMGVSNRDPILYTVQVLTDGPPEVAIVVPGGDTDLPETQRVAVQVEASDDFGISRVDLVFQVDDGPPERLPLPVDGSRQLRVTYDWDLSSRELLPEDRVRYHAEAFDNDGVAGPKVARSPTYVLRFPSLYELFDEASQAQDERLTSLEELATEEAGARDFIEQVRREVLRSESLTWEQKKELEAALAAEEARARAVEELAREMADSVDKLEQGGLTSGDLLDKLDEIRELMAAVASAEMLEALQALQQAVEAPDAEQLAEALRRFMEDQDAFQERLDRTLDLLRQVHAEQRLLAASARAEDLRDRQSQINDALERQEATDRLREQESSLARDTDRLAQELAELGREMEELSPPTAAALQAQAGQMQQQQLSGRMRQMQQQLEAGQQQQAERLGEGLEEDLGKLSEQLEQLQGQFSGSQRRDMSRKLRAAMAGLVDLSQRQEALAAQTAARGVVTVAELAAAQQALAQGVEITLEQIAIVGSRTMAIEQGLPATLGYVLQRMGRAASRLGQRDAGNAEPLQIEAMGYLNEAVLQLRQSIDNLSQARMPSAFGEAMEKLMGLSQQQAALNQATQQAMQQGSQPGQQGRGRSGLDALPRLAAEQRRIYQALAEIEKSTRGQRSLHDRVGQIRQEMEAVMARMQRRQADPRVSQGQQRILQRMLEASRSIHARGFDKRRRSETGTQRAYAGPDWLPVDLGQRPDALREAMRRALAAGFPPEYRALIQRYYEDVYQDLHDGGDTEALP